MVGCDLVPYIVPIPLAKKSGGFRVGNAEVVLPHELWQSLSQPDKSSTFREIFGSAKDWRQWWRAAEGETWFENHPFKQWIKDNPDLACPFLLHGDSAPIGKRGNRGLRVMSWRSPLSKATTLRKKLLICCNNSKDEHFNAHCRELDSVTAWSFKQCFKNEMPAQGHDDQKLHGQRGCDAGAALNRHGVLPIFCGTVGDWLFHVEAFDVPYFYNTSEVCMQCGACKAAGPLNYGCALEDAPWTMAPRNHDDYMASKEASGSLNPICEVEGWHTHNLWEDALHCDYLGVRQVLCGSVLKVLCDAGVWEPGQDGEWKDKMDFQLHLAYREFCVWTQSQHVTCSISPFSCATLSLKNKHSWARLKSKAAQCCTVSLWLAAKMETLATSTPTDHNKIMATTLWGFSELTRLYSLKSFMNQTEISELRLARTAALVGFHRLSKIAMQEGTWVFHMIPKFHMMDHMVRRSIRTGVAVALTWTFTDEDFMGLLARVAAAGHALSTNKVPVQRWLLGFFNGHDVP